ncbi:YihY/virulence factor BrkB family protein [Pseudaquabacterium rugosum]|uniref:YihY/virulence factor BrkB family protein n=1 Tax=Pseudaquabacterium rugosum TaxID=2984194 RepID=A0ABU9BDB0_9BURK
MPALDAPAAARNAALSWRSLGRLLGDTVQAWLDDRAASMGAAIAYYTLFSLAPLLLVVLSVAGTIWGPDAARGAVAAQLSGVLGAEGARAVQALLDSVGRPGHGLLASGLGLLAVCIGATTVLAELQGALDVIWRAPPSRAAGWWQWLRVRLWSLGLLLGLGFLLIVSLMADAALAALQVGWGPRLAGLGDTLAWAGVVNHAIGFGLMVALVAMIYKGLPRRRVAWSDVWIGALVTATLMQLGKLGIGRYIELAGVASGFGAAGTLVAVLVWVYWSAQIFLLGAEFTWVWAYRHGSHRHTRLPARPGDVGVGIGIGVDTGTGADADLARPGRAGR